MSKYDALWKHIAAQDEDVLKLSFSQIGEIAGIPLDRIVRASRNRAESDLAELLVEMMTVLDVEKLTFCKRDLIQILRYHDIKMDEGQLRRILNDNWKLPHEGNAPSYTFYQVDQGSLSR